MRGDQNHNEKEGEERRRTATLADLSRAIYTYMQGLGVRPMTLYNIMRGWLLWCEAALAETVSATGERRGDSGGHRLSGAIHCRESEEKEGLRDRGREGGCVWARH